MTRYQSTIDLSEYRATLACLDMILRRADYSVRRSLVALGYDPVAVDRWAAGAVVELASLQNADDWKAVLV